MYWTTLSLFLLVEAQLNFILSWVPFYSWMRLFVHLYLVLPGQQGCVFIYKEHIHPFLEEHERQIDRMIADLHEKAKSAGLDGVKRAIEYVRVQFLGQQPSRPSPPPSRNVSYTTQLFNRFAMPSAREGLAAVGTTDIFGLIGKAIQQTSYPDATSTDAQARDLARSGALIPPNLSGDERDQFVSTQREHLRTLLQAFDAEAFHRSDVTPPPRSSMPRAPSGRKSYLAPERDGPSHMHKSRSESEFEDLAYESMPDPDNYRPHADHDEPLASARREGAGWSSWIWGSYGERDSALNTKKDL